MAMTQTPFPSGVALWLLVARPWIVRNIPMAAAATGTATARARDCRVFMPVSSMLIDVPDDAWVMLPAQLGGTSRAIGLGASPPVVGVCREFFISANTVSRLGDYAGLAPATTGMIRRQPPTGKSNYGY
jgi:hypothetical protein